MVGGFPVCSGKTFAIVSSPTVLQYNGGPDVFRAPAMHPLWGVA